MVLQNYSWTTVLLEVLLMKKPFLRLGEQSHLDMNVSLHAKIQTINWSRSSVLHLDQGRGCGRVVKTLNCLAFPQIGKNNMKVPYSLS